VLDRVDQRGDGGGGGAPLPGGPVRGQAAEPGGQDGLEAVDDRLAVRAELEDRDSSVSARTLLDPGHAGRTYYLTSPQSLTQIQQAEAIAAAIGQQVRFEELSPETFRQYAAQRFHAPVVDDLLRNWAQSVGRAADIAPDLEKIIGRPATTYAQWAAQHADAYR
jgi:hypothetical protein